MMLRKRWGIVSWFLACGAGCIPPAWECDTDQPCPGGKQCVFPEDLSNETNELPTAPRCYEVCNTAQDCASPTDACFGVCLGFDLSCAEKECAPGFECSSAKLCQKIPAVAVCTDNILGPGETDVDCGGLCDSKCAAGKDCRADADCTTGYCEEASKTCAVSTCVDAVKNQDEADVDCGGGCPSKCVANQSCAGPADCVSGVCNTVCVAPTCDDRVRNQEEAGVDCGGSGCAECPALSVDPPGGGVLSGVTPIVLTFGKAIAESDRAQVKLGEELGEQAEQPPVWSEAGDTLTVVPAMTWKHGLERRLSVTYSAAAIDAVLKYNVDNPLRRVSVDFEGAEVRGSGAGVCRAVSGVSERGRRVVFQTDYPLVDSDTNLSEDVYVWDIEKSTTSRLSVNAKGAEAAFGGAYGASMSNDGRYVAFGASGLIGTEFAYRDVYIRGLGEPSTFALASVPAVAVRDNWFSASGIISGDGLRVLLDAYLGRRGPFGIYSHDLGTRVTTQVLAPSTFYPWNLLTNDDGSVVAFASYGPLVPADKDIYQDVYVLRDGELSLATSAVADVPDTGYAQLVALSGDGDSVMFSSEDQLIKDAGLGRNLFIANVTTGKLTQVNKPSTTPCNCAYSGDLSQNGQLVVFTSPDPDLVPGVNEDKKDQVFVRNLGVAEPSYRLVSTSTKGTGNGVSFHAKISPDGRYIAFSSKSSNLIESDKNGIQDCFLAPTPY